MGHAQRLYFGCSEGITKYSSAVDQGVLPMPHYHAYSQRFGPVIGVRQR
jgi:hypothetical protein